jgi:nicotinate-nucleotide adenylyltransferase
VSSIGIYGGTFDPIHLGHLVTAQAVKEIRSLEKIIFIPANVSPFKKGVDSSEAADRFKMIELALEGIPYFEISDIEISKPGVSYTIDTLVELKNLYKNIELIIGEDSLINFDKWKEPERILEISKLIVLRRKIVNKGEEDIFSRSAVYVQTPIIEISATEIRRRVQENLPIDFLVPQKVKEYIYNQKLYKE